jgi:hypothetical protein
MWFAAPVRCDNLRRAACCNRPAVFVELVVALAPTAAADAMNVDRLHARDVHERVRPDRVEFHTVRARVRVCNQRSQTDASFRLTHVTCQGVAEGIGRGEGNSTGQVLPLYPPASKAADGGLRRHRGKADTLAARRPDHGHEGRRQRALSTLL